jgi:membrane protein DedA with SNARE-associated domain
MTFSLIGSLVDVLTSILRTVGLPGLFALMIVESFGIPPIPSEVILPFAGFLVADGVYGFVPAVVVAVAGGLVGAYLAYAVGRWWRHRIEGIGFGYLRLSPRRLARMDAYFARRGEITVAAARLLPIVRSYISYPAGTARMSPSRFGVFTAIGATPFAVALIYAGVVLRSNWDLIEQDLGLFDDVLIALVVIAVVYLGLVALGWIRPKFLAEPEPKAPPAASAAPPPRTP